LRKRMSKREQCRGSSQARMRALVVELDDVGLTTDACRAAIAARVSEVEDGFDALGQGGLVGGAIDAAVACAPSRQGQAPVITQLGGLGASRRRTLHRGRHRHGYR